MATAFPVAFSIPFFTTAKPARGGGQSLCSSHPVSPKVNCRAAAAGPGGPQVEQDRSPLEGGRGAAPVRGGRAAGDARRRPGPGGAAKEGLLGLPPPPQYNNVSRAPIFLPPRGGRFPGTHRPCRSSRRQCSGPGNPPPCTGKSWAAPPPPSRLTLSSPGARGCAGARSGPSPRRPTSPRTRRVAPAASPLPSGAPPRSPCRAGPG